MGDFEMVSDPIDNEETIERNDSITQTDIINLKNIFDYRFLSQIIIHIGVHITLLSLFEPLFYFLYVTNIEKNLFFSQIKALINKFINNLDVDLINSILTNPLFNYLIISNFGNETYVDNYFKELKTNYDNSMNENNQNEHDLQVKSYFFTILAFFSTTLYFIIHQCIFNEKYLFLKIMLEHSILVLFIGLYEYWFFNTIVLNYSPWTEDEIIYYIITCGWSKAVKRIPLLDSFSKNHTICKID